MSVADGAKIIATGLYKDELVKVDGAWRYTHRTVTIDS